MIPLAGYIHVLSLVAPLNPKWYISNRLGDKMVGANEVHGDGRIRGALRPATMATHTIYYSVSSLLYVVAAIHSSFVHIS
jgi:hypothetical protein